MLAMLPTMKEWVMYSADEVVFWCCMCMLAIAIVVGWL